MKVLVSSLFFAAFVFVHNAGAQELVGVKVLDPESKSYFELRNDGGTWLKAQQRAAGLVYKGIRGRLAVVENPGVHSFLRETFKIRHATWIGLRYWCKFRALQWVTGSIHKASEFSPWAARWKRENDLAPCTGASTKQTGFMPVYYTPVSKGFRWQAVDSGKGFKWYFVEYPAAAEAE